MYLMDARGYGRNVPRICQTGLSCRAAGPYHYEVKNPTQSTLRDPFNAVSHLAGAALAVPGMAALVILSDGDRLRIVSSVIYGISLLCLFLASGVYHAAHVPPHRLVMLRRLDHAAIYVLIAGTYTPFCLLALTEFWRWGMLSVIWLLAIAGVGTSMLMLNAPRRLTAGVYVVMGWLVVFAGRELMASISSPVLGWLIAGGALYTFGAVIYATRKADFFPGVFGFHEVWHVFVLLGAAAHYAAVAGVM